MLAYVAVFVAALLTGSGTGQVTGGVEAASSTASRLLESIAIYLPLGWAFGAGMVAAVNPCGFAMLPAYLSLYLGASESREQAGDGHRLLSAARVGLAMTAGFVLLFGTMGLILSLATSTIAAFLPWAGLTIGAGLVLFGGLMLRDMGTGTGTATGSLLYTGVGERIADRLGRDARQPGLRGYLIYGLAYGAASLSCTLPIFLAVVGGTLTASGFLDSLLQFVLYGLGMGFVIVLLTLALALFQSAAVRVARRVVRSVQAASAVFMLLAGAYVMYYWLTLGGLLERLS